MKRKRAFHNDESSLNRQLTVNYIQSVASQEDRNYNITMTRELGVGCMLVSFKLYVHYMNT
jgi:hypothetical protein